MAYERYTRAFTGSTRWGRVDYLETLDLLCNLLCVPVPVLIIREGGGGAYYSRRWPTETGQIRLGRSGGYRVFLHELAHHVAWWRCYRRTQRVMIADAIHHNKVFIRALRSVLNAADINIKEYANQAHYAIEKRMTL